MTPSTSRKVRGRWVVLVIVWLILASSISLEQGQQTVSEWGSAAIVVVIGLLVLLAFGRVAAIPLRAACRRARRWVHR